MQNYFNVGEIYKSKEYPEQDFLVTGVCYHEDTDNYWSDYVLWQTVDIEKWKENIAKKKGYNSAEAMEQDNKTYFPHVCCGECNPKSLKAKVKKHNMYLDKQIKFITSKSDEGLWEYTEYIDEVNNKKDKSGFFII